MVSIRIWLGLVWSLALLAGSGCSTDAEFECPQGQRPCSDGVCRECCAPDDCPADLFCDEQGFCSDDWSWYLGRECLQDRDGCPGGMACDPFLNECAYPCQSDAECANSHADIDFASYLQCQGDGTCDFQHCANDAQCRPGTVCYDGDCVYWRCVDEWLSRCTVFPRSAVTRTGTTVQLSAAAYMISGALAPGVRFNWSSDDSDIATVTGGMVTGGTNTGTAIITATVAGCQTTCTADVRNYGAVAAGARVVVINELTGAPMEGVTVDLEGVGSEVSDATGVATFAGADLTAAPATVTISAANIGYVSFMAADSNDLIAHVGLLPDPTVAGGYRGQFDFSKVICDPGNPCEVKLGFTGASIPGNLFNLNLDSLIGERILTHFELGGTSEDVPLPSGLVLGLNDTWFRQSYEATGTAGTRVAWGLGGKLNLADLIEPLGMLFADEDHAFGLILSMMLPLLSELFTSLTPNVDIAPRAKVVDVDDINGDGDTTDLVPDFANFPALPGGDMVFKVPMDQTLTITVPALPSDGAGGYLYDGVIVLAGVLVRDAGLVPLGLSAGLDAGSPDGPPDGQIANISLSASDVAGRLPEGSYRRVVIAVALNIAKLRDPDNTDPAVIAGQVHFVNSFDGSLTLNGPMSPAAYTHDQPNRRVDLTNVPAGADAVVLLASSAAGTWQIFHPAVTGLIDLPTAPASGDRSDRLNLAALKFAGNVTYSDLIAFNATNLNELVTLVSDFVVVYPSGQGPLIGCSTSGRASGAVAWLGLLALALSSVARRRWPCSSTRPKTSEYSDKSEPAECTFQRAEWGRIEHETDDCFGDLGPGSERLRGRKFGTSQSAGADRRRSVRPVPGGQRLHRWGWRRGALYQPDVDCPGGDQVGSLSGLGVQPRLAGTGPGRRLRPPSDGRLCRRSSLRQLGLRKSRLRTAAPLRGHGGRYLRRRWNSILGTCPN